MKQAIFSTNKTFSPILLRVFLAIVLFPHGAQKLLGWFGGYGFEGSMNYFTESQGLPWIIGFGVIIIEFIGAISIFLGFATRLWSTAILFLTIGIMVTNHSTFFFMNWFGNQPAEGMEYFLLMLGMSGSLIVSGAGKLSIDSLISDRRKQDEFKEAFALTNARA
jgi:putative oxidoreductase